MMSLVTERAGWENQWYRWKVKKERETDGGRNPLSPSPSFTAAFLSFTLSLSLLLSLCLFLLPPSLPLQVFVWARGHYRGRDRCEWQICYPNTNLLPHWDPTSPQCHSVWPPLHLCCLDPSWWVALYLEYSIPIDGWRDGWKQNIFTKGS